MTHKQMLKRLGLSEGELRDLVRKYSAFRKRLKPAQRRHLDRRLKVSLRKAAATFGPRVTAAQVQDFLAQRAGADPQALIVVCLVSS